jgi:hypothetical protein
MSISKPQWPFSKLGISGKGIHIDMYEGSDPLEILHRENMFLRSELHEALQRQVAWECCFRHLAGGTDCTVLIQREGYPPHPLLDGNFNRSQRSEI